MFEYLICPGNMKCSTTMLYRQLIQHPGIRRAHRKELHYFDMTDPDTLSKEDYDSQYRPGKGLKLDVTPFYLFHEDSLPRIASILDVSKVAMVVLLRDPVDRAFSQYRMRLSQKFEDKPFTETFALENERIQKCVHDSQIFSYFSQGKYASQLDRLYSIIPSENIRIYLFEDFIRNQQAVLDDICAFAGLEPFTFKESVENRTILHVRSKKLESIIEKIAKRFPKKLRRKWRWLHHLRNKVSEMNEDKTIKDVIDPDFEKFLVKYYMDDVRILKEKYGLAVNHWKHYADV